MREAGRKRPTEGERKKKGLEIKKNEDEKAGEERQVRGVEERKRDFQFLDRWQRLTAKYRFTRCCSERSGGKQRSLKTHTFVETGLNRTNVIFVDVSSGLKHPLYCNYSN